MNEINLVSGENLDFEKKQAKTQKILKISAIIALLGVAFISIFFFIITLLLPTSTVKKEQAQTVKDISGLHKKLVTHVLIRDRIINIKGILAQRKDYPKVTNDILAKLPSDMTVDVLTLESGLLIVSVSGSSLMSINQYIDDLVKLADSSSNIKNFYVQKLQYNLSSLNYTLTLQADVL